MRNLSSLQGTAQQEQQIPITLLHLGIPAPDGPWAICDFDETIYLNRATGAATLSSFNLPAGYDPFFPYAGFIAPQIQQSTDAALSEISFKIANVDQAWYSVIANGSYRDAPVAVWQGNIQLVQDQSPETATVAGVVQVYNGLVSRIEATHESATLTVVPPSAIFRQVIPFRTFPSSEFRFLPVPGTKLSWGFDERTL